jgi:plastocyanin
MRRLALAAALAALAATVLAGAARAANQTVQAVDGTAANNFVNTWSPAAVTVTAGDTVTWVFPDSNVSHNVVANSPNWSLTNPFGPHHAPVSFTFAAQGTYAFVCEVHRSTMHGTVTVTDASGNPPPPPPPPPLSEQPFQNDQPSPTVLEITDDSRPALSRVRASRIARGARVRFRVSEPGSVTVRVKRGRRTVKSRTIRLARAGARTINLRGLRPGSYRIEVLARDLADNRSRIKRARVTVGR